MKIFFFLTKPNRLEPTTFQLYLSLLPYSLSAHQQNGIVPWSGDFVFLLLYNCSCCVCLTSCCCLDALSQSHHSVKVQLLFTFCSFSRYMSSFSSEPDCSLYSYCSCILPRDTDVDSFVLLPLLL